MILKHKQSNVWRIAFGLLLVTLLALVGLTDAKPVAKVENNEPIRARSVSEGQETAAGNVSDQLTDIPSLR